VAIFSDAFTDTNGVELHAHNAAWTVVDGTWEIDTNKARMTTDGARGHAVAETGVTDQDVTATIHTPNTTPADENDEWFNGLVARCDGTANNLLMARWIYSSLTEVELWEIIGGSGYLIGMVKMTSLLAPNTDYAVELIVKGNDVCVIHAGKLVIRVKTDLLTGTMAGIGAEAKGGVGNRPTWDTFSVRGVA
jgi:hypothetical protein